MARSVTFGRRRAIGLVTAVLAACAGILAAAAPAQADEFGQVTSTSGAIPDNFNHWFCFSGSNWTTTWRSVVTSRMQNLDSQTSYTDSQEGNGCTSLTDIVFILDSGLGSSTRGLYSCTAFNNGDDDIPGSGDEECETSVIRLNPTLLTDSHQRLKTACHEIGHSVGLAHGSNSATFWNDCMISGAVAAGIQWEQYNAHHVAHANSRVPTTS